MPLDETLNRAAMEVEKGRLWRAREILCSSIQAYGYAPELFRSIADLMVQMGDELEAGKYYLLCVSEPYENELKAMECFLSRHQNSEYRQLISMFPPQSRFPELKQYPTYLQNHLRAIGAGENLKPKVKSNALSNQTAGFLFIFAIVAFVCFAILGFATAVALLAGLL